MKLRYAILGLAGCLAFGAASSPRAQTPSEFSPGDIDRMIQTEWKTAGMMPAPKVDDARFLRRVYLDITGTLPPPEAVTAFLQNKSQYKRVEIVNQLLESPDYVEHWTNYWDSTLMGRQVRMRNVDRDSFRGWIKTEFAKNAPYNKFVYDLLTATGQNGDGKAYGKLAAAVQKVGNKKKAANVNQAANGLAANRRKKNKNAVIAQNNPTPATLEGATMQTDPKMSADPKMMADPKMQGEPTMQTAPKMKANADKDGMAMMDQMTEREPDQPINGAVNWYLKYAGTPADLSGNASRIFLGVQIQCAQCHDHKTEKWKQTDFQQFTACFTRTRGTNLDKGQKGGFQRIVLKDQDGTRGIRRPNPNAKNKKANALLEYASAKPAALDGTDFSSQTNRREALAKWMTSDENPWFAQEIVNRMWAYFMGRGFVDPIDDFRTTNPATMPDLLKKLADDFIANKYDLKYLIRTICATQAYQLACSPAKNNDTRNTLWASHRLKEMEPETLMSAVIQATNMEPVLNRLPGNNASTIKLGLARQFTFLFDVDEEFEQKEFEGTIPQALMLLNGNMVNSGTTPIPGTALADTLALPGDDDAKITSLYLRTLSRRPSMTELSYWREFVNRPREVVKTDGAPLPKAQPTLREMRQAGKLDAQAIKKIAQSKRNNGVDPLARFSGRMQAQTATPKQQAYEDVFWTLLNSSEFIFNH